MARRALLVCIVLLVVASGIAGAQARGEPLLRVSVADDNVDPGETTSLSLTVANEGDLEWASTTNPSLTQQVTTARAITVQLEAEDAPFTVETSERLIGSLQEGGSTQVPFRIHVDEGAKPGTYEVPVVLEYAYTRYVSRDGFTFQEDARIEQTVTVTIAKVPQFDVVSTTESVRSGETGEFSVTLENSGSAIARDSSVTLTAGSGLGFGVDQGQQAERFSGRWAPGERRTLEFQVRPIESNTSRMYSMDIHVAYRDDDGKQRRSNPISIGVRANPTPSFTFDNLTASLRVDDRGRITGTIVNAGSTPVRNVVIQLESLPSGLTPRTATVPVGDLEPGERTRFELVVDVRAGLASGTYQLTLLPRYDGHEMTSLAGDSHVFRVDIEDEQEPFEFSVVNGTVTPDTDNYHLSMKVTNVGEETREDIVLRLSPGAPFTSSTPMVLVPTMNPGESTRVVFDLSVDEDAVTGTYPINVNVTSDTLDRDDEMDGPYLLAVEVIEPAEGPTNLAIIALAALLVVIILGAGWWWLRGN